MLGVGAQESVLCLHLRLPSSHVFKIGRSCWSSLKRPALYTFGRRPGTVKPGVVGVGGCGRWSVGAVDVRWVWISSWPVEAAAWPRVAQMEAPPAPGSPPVEPRVPGGGQSE